MAALLLALLLAAPADKKLYEKDVAFALKAIEKNCGHFFKLKGIQWGKVKAQFRRDVKRVKTHEQHWMLLWRLLCRLKDGHASVYAAEATRGLEWPGESLEAGLAMSWCTPDGKRFYVLRAAGDAQKSGVKPGMQVLLVDGKAVDRWIRQRIVELSDQNKLYTPHQSLYFACRWGLGGPENSRLKVEFSGKKLTLTRKRKQRPPYGPVVLPGGLKRTDRVLYGKLASGCGYIYISKVPRDLIGQLDTILGELGNVPGMILDFRGNGGGGCDHDAFFGRFIPKGRSTHWGKRYHSAGPNPYGGPLVVIVDAGACSSAETLSGIFKEDGRGYMIGPSPTAGMSSSKITIDLPSRLFTLRVSVASNKGRFNGNKGVEGIGVPPHELVPYDPKELAEGVDTQIRRAQELLQKPLSPTEPGS